MRNSALPKQEQELSYAHNTRTPGGKKPQLSWPQHISHEPTLKIGEVRTLLTEEFPLLSLSKIRHYESVGLIKPYRTPSNQRLFSLADAERLRFVLREQRDRFLPLENIKELLSELDAGTTSYEAHPAGMRAVHDEEMRKPQPGERLSVDRVVALTGAPVKTIHEFIEAGLLARDPRGRLSSHSVDIVRYCMMLIDRGFDLRHIKTVRNSVRSHAAIVTQRSAQSLARKTPVARERALTQVAEDSAAMVRLYEALLTENIEVELR